jgi:hypothetical protein
MQMIVEAAQRGATAATVCRVALAAGSWQQAPKIVVEG